MKLNDDQTIKRIREARHRISEAYDHDPRKLVEHYIELQKKYERQLLKDTEEEMLSGATKT